MDNKWFFALVGVVEAKLFLLGIFIGLFIGGVFAYALFVSQPAKTVTSTVSVTATQTTTATTTSVSTLTTFSIPPTYDVKGSITHYSGIIPKLIGFASPNAKFNFTVSADTYQGTLSNSLPYTVTLYWEYPSGLGGLQHNGCGSFNQTVAWGSSTITMNWNC